MARVISSTAWSHTFVCRRCQAVAEAETADVRFGYFGANYGGESPQPAFYVVCPACGSNHFLADAAITPNVAKAARERAGRN